MVGPVELVQHFCAEWGDGMGRVRNAVAQRFTAATVWENVGFSVTTGPEEAVALWEGFSALGFSDIRVEMLHIAAIGNIVLTERIDHLLASDGQPVFSPRVMGTFEIAGDKIAAWRDYTDPAVLAQITARAAAALAPTGSNQ